MTRIKQVRPHVLLLAGLLLCTSALGAAPIHVAVFNFQMKSATPDWRWLEKCLADQITTDLSRSGRLSVVARDRMQQLAHDMGWVPELAVADPRRMGRIRSELRIEYLVTGLCAVAAGRLEITAQIIQARTRKEVFRKTAAGKAGELIDLQKGLSTELMSWLVKKPAGQILPTLPVWTRSIPALKALYEGMDLYDQGRYAEAWLKFRRASREDPAYVEAVYWVGKMYYFMDRYEHARRALERFVYLDTFHPRIGDALVEYVHTYENRDVPAEWLLALYANVRRRCPGATVWEGWGWGDAGRMDFDEWLRHKSAQLLGQVGRHEQAVDTRYPAAENLLPIEYLSGRPFGTARILQHHALTGRAVKLDVLAKEGAHRYVVVPVAPGRPEGFVRQPRPNRILGKKRRKLDKWAMFDPDHVYRSMCLVAPSGHVFTSVRCYPVVEGDGGSMELSVRVLEMGPPIVPPRTMAAAEAQRRGLLADNLPRTGILVISCVIRVDDDGGPLVVKGFRLSVAMEKLGAVGAIDVWCRDTGRFRVEVDGAFGRWNRGVVGPLAPGKHTVRLSPVERDSPYTQWTTNATVAPNQVTRLIGRLPWKDSSPWSAWTAAGIEPVYPGYDLRLYKRDEAPSIHADGEAIRLVWSRRGDLWSSASTDGKTFHRPRKLDLPVSSRWLETRPKLLRDESGRFVLCFLSDRDRRHRMPTYLCWSRDFVHWSAPSLLRDLTSWTYDVFHDDRGRFVWVAPTTRGVRTMVSREGYRWERLGSLACAQAGGYARDVAMLQRDDGQYELFLAQVRPTRRGEDARARKDHFLITRYVSGDARTWSRPEILAKIPWRTEMPRLAAAHGNRRSALLANWYSGEVTETASCGSILFRESPDDTWRRSAEMSPMFFGYASMAFHPRWGYLITWSQPQGREGSPAPGSGPFLLLGARVDPLVDVRLEPPRSAP